MQSFWRNLCRNQSHVANTGILPFKNFKIYSNTCHGLSTSECTSGGGGEAIHFLRHISSRNQNEIGSPSYRGLHSFLKHQFIGPCTAWINAPTRNMTTDVHPGKPVDEDRSDATTHTVEPQRIKFKRLDKTARHIMNILDKEEVDKVRGSRDIPDIKPGYIVQLRVEVPENKSRVSILKGIVIARRNAGLHTTFRLRRMVAGVGVESVFPLYSPNIKEMKVLDKKDVRRAKLYYLRTRMNALKHK